MYKEKELEVHKQRTKAEICETARESFSQTTESSMAKFCERFKLHFHKTKEEESRGSNYCICEKF
jgi:hypothetical protein